VNGHIYAGHYGGFGWFDPKTSEWSLLSSTQNSTIQYFKAESIGFGSNGKVYIGSSAQDVSIFELDGQVAFTGGLKVNIMSEVN
jgi:hypothetical protein